MRNMIKCDRRRARVLPCSGWWYLATSISGYCTLYILPSDAAHLTAAVNYAIVYDGEDYKTGGFAARLGITIRALLFCKAFN